MLKTFRNVIALSIVCVFSFQSAHALSLKMKKEKTKVEQKIESTLKKSQDKCGCTPKVEVNWEDYKTKAEMMSVSRSVDNVVGGMVRICKDFKKEVCDGVKTINVTWGKLHKSLKGGVLEIGRAKTNEGWGEQQIAKMIEENL